MEVTLIATPDYSLNTLLDEDLFFDKHLYEERDGHLSIESLQLDSLETFRLLINYLFNTRGSLPELSRNENCILLDLSAHKVNILSFEQLESSYEEWLSKSKRPNTMDEYGMLLGITGYVRRHLSEKYLIVRLTLN